MSSYFTSCALTTLWICDRDRHREIQTDRAIQTHKHRQEQEQKQRGREPWIKDVWWTKQSVWAGSIINIALWGFGYISPHEQAAQPDTYFISLVDLLDSSVLQKVCNTSTFLSSPVSMCLQSWKMESKPSTGSNEKGPHANFKCSMGCLIKKQKVTERQRSERITSLYLICMILHVGTCIITHICFNHVVFEEITFNRRIINGKR